MKLNKIYAGKEDDHKLSDAIINLKENGTLPFLVFHDGFINNKTVLTETLDNLSVAVDVYGKNGNDEIEVKAMCNIVSKTAGMQSLYYHDTTSGYLATLSPIQTLAPEYFRNRSLDSTFTCYPSTFNTGVTNETLLGSKAIGVMTLPKPENGFGDTITVKTISLKGTRTFSLVDRVKEDIDGGSLYNEHSLLPLLEIDTTKFNDWDPKTLPFHTLVQVSNNNFKLMYVGPQDVTKFYIPLQ